MDDGGAGPGRGFACLDAYQANRPWTGRTLDPDSGRKVQHGRLGEQGLAQPPVAQGRAASTDPVCRIGSFDFRRSAGFDGVTARYSGVGAGTLGLVFELAQELENFAEVRFAPSEDVRSHLKTSQY